MSNPKVLSEKTLTALGALCLDQGFRKDFIAHPSKQTAQNLGIVMSDSEYDDFNAIVSAQSGPQEADFDEVRSVVCPKRPCMYAKPGIETMFGAAIVSDEFRTDLFADPDTAPAHHNFKLSRAELKLLSDLIQGPKRAAIQQAMELLAEKIQALSISYALPVAA